MILSVQRFCQQIKRITTCILVCIVFIFSSSEKIHAEGDPAVKTKVKVVVIDPGHGGKDPGALGKKYKEKDVVLAIALKLGKYIEENYPEVQIIYTRKTDIFIPLDERAAIANRNKADLFISIHANSLPNSPAHGTETFVMGINKNAGNFEVAKKENSVITLEDNYEIKYEGFDPNSIESYIVFSIVQKTYQEQSLFFADLVQKEFTNRAKRVNRGVKQDGFLVLWRTSMPGVLVETGFLTNTEEEKYLGSESGQEYLASAIFRAFRLYKESIESKSHFETVADKADAEALQNTSNEALITNNIVENESINFKIQILSTKNPLKLDDPYFKNYKFAKEFKNGKWYKYAIGESSSYEEILKYSKEVRKDFPDAFVIAVKNGEIVNLKQALEEIKN